MIQKGLFTRPDIVDEKLYVISPIFNPQRFRARWKLYTDFEKYVLSYGEAHLVSIECSFGERQEVLVEKLSENHTVINVYTNTELWMKENLVNIAISRLPKTWKYVAWVDGDIRFTRPDWVGETIQKLQHFDIVQMFSEALDIGPDYQTINRHKGFMWSYKSSQKADKTYSGWHPGFAWAARRSYIDTVGGLLDFSILGAGDRNMATALIGRLEDSIPPGLSSNYLENLQIWADRAKLIDKNVGYVDGTISHYWHGAKKNRKYRERWQILIEEKFEPDFDIKRDWQGVWQWAGNKYRLRDRVRDYFAERNEDSIDL